MSRGKRAFLGCFIVFAVAVLTASFAGWVALSNLNRSFEPPSEAQVVDTSADLILSSSSAVITGHLVVTNAGLTGAADDPSLGLSLGLPEFASASAGADTSSGDPFRDAAVALTADPNRSGGPCVGPCELDLYPDSCARGCQRDFPFRVQLLGGADSETVRVRLTAGLASSPGSSLPGNASVEIKIDSASK